MRINAPRDENNIPALLATSSADGQTPVLVYADPVTHRLLTQLVNPTSPSSPSGSIQFNNSGVFGGSDNATLDAFGNMQIASLNVNGTSSFNNNYSAGTALLVYDHNGDTALSVDGLSGVYTLNNTLDDGSGKMIAGSFVKSGGTSSQFLKGDGSVDSNTYLTTSSASSTYVPYTGATTDLDFNAKSLKNFFISKTADTTAKFTFDVSGLSTGTTRTLTVPNRTFTFDNITTSTTSNLTAGSIPFSTGSAISQDNSNLFWDSTNHRLGLGTTSPAYTLDVNGGLNVASGNSYYYNGVATITAQTALGNYYFGGGGNFSATGQHNFVIGNGMTGLTSGNYNTAIGYNSLYSNQGGGVNVAIGWQALYNNTSGSNNLAIGASALYSNTTGGNSTAIGIGAMSNNTGSGNTGLGYNVMSANTSAGNNTAIGYNSSLNNQTGGSNVTIGWQSGFNATTLSNSILIGAATGNGSGGYYTTTGATVLGYFAGENFLGSADYNTLIGYKSGNKITSGNRNILIGQSTISASYSQVTTGSSNVAIGDDVALPSATASNQLVISNMIYGTGLSGTGSTVSTGKIGIGVTAPSYTLDVNGDINTSGVYRAGGTAGITTTVTTASLVGKTITITNGIITSFS